MKDRRKYMRFDASLSVNYELMGSVPVKNTSRLKDLSREGLRISLDSALPRASILKLEMEPPPGVERDPIIAFGEVIWYRLNADSTYEAGMRFSNIKREDKTLLLDYVYKKWVKTQNKA